MSPVTLAPHLSRPIYCLWERGIWPPHEEHWISICRPIRGLEFCFDQYCSQYFLRNSSRTLTELDLMFSQVWGARPVRLPGALSPPLKFVHWSDRSSAGLPLRATKRQRAIREEFVWRLESTSKFTARVVSHLFLRRWPIFEVEGPKQSMPVEKKGDSLVSI